MTDHICRCDLYFHFYTFSVYLYMKRKTMYLAGLTAEKKERERVKKAQKKMS